MSLDLYKLNSTIPLSLKTDIDVKKNNHIIKSEDAGILYESSKNEITIENEIIIEIKKNDTFSKVIDPYFQNNIIKNKIY